MASERGNSKRVKLAAPESTRVVTPPSPSPSDDSEDTEESSAESDSSEEISSDEDSAAGDKSEENGESADAAFPTMKERDVTAGGLKERATALLAAMKASNETLNGLRKEGRLNEVAIEQVAEGEPFIEMDLGLGVLEEQRSDDEEEESSSEEENENAESLGNIKDETITSVGGPSKTDTLSKLMGQPRTKRKALIQEVEDTG